MLKKNFQGKYENSLNVSLTFLLLLFCLFSVLIEATNKIMLKIRLDVKKIKKSVILIILTL